MDNSLHPNGCTCYCCVLEQQLIKAANAVVMPAVKAGKLTPKAAADLMREAFTRRGAKMTALTLPGDTLLASARVKWAAQVFTEIGFAVIAKEAEKPKEAAAEKPVVMLQ